MNDDLFYVRGEGMSTETAGEGGHLGWSLLSSLLLQSSVLQRFSHALSHPNKGTSENKLDNNKQVLVIGGGGL